MKKKQKDELRTKDIKELNNLLSKARGSLLDLQLDIAQNKLKNTRSIFLKRKEIAYILTLINEKEDKDGKKSI